MWKVSWRISTLKPAIAADRDEQDCSGFPNPHGDTNVNEYHRTRGMPRPVTGVRAKHLLERFADLSRPFCTNVRVIGEIAEIVLG